jgi:hypothetical protein
MFTVQDYSSRTAEANPTHLTARWKQDMLAAWGHHMQQHYMLLGVMQHNPSPGTVGV